MPIESILKEEKKLIVNIVDNLGILKSINFYAIKYGLRDRIFINYFFHGYYFDIDSVILNETSSIDKLILLTNSSYDNFLKVSRSLPFEVAILPNGIKSIFTKMSEDKKNKIKDQLGFKRDKIYFLWLSQNRPKKGLKIILNTWKRLTKNRFNIELIVIGADEKKSEGSIHYLGKIPNDELPVYYQACDYYLFSTLCHEGYPLSLLEALKSGLKCIVSDIDPLNEVLQGGNLGYLVKQPNKVQNWVDAVNDVLENEYNFNKENINLDELNNFDTWKTQFLEIISQSKLNM